jgi:hypothetical protein
MAKRTEINEVPSGSATPQQGGQGGGTQPPADASAPRPGGASFNSEQGFSDPRNAPEGTPAPALAENRDPDGPQAARTDPNTIHAMRGMQIGTPVLGPDGRPVVGGGMIAGGAIANEFLPPAPAANPGDVMAEWTRRALASPHFSILGALAGRPVTDWGLFGKGATVRGLVIGINVDTLEKDVFHDGHVIEKDGVWANARNFPEYIVTGDNLSQLAGR